MANKSDKKTKDTNRKPVQIYKETFEELSKFARAINDHNTFAHYSIQSIASYILKQAVPELNKQLEQTKSQGNPRFDIEEWSFKSQKINKA